MRFRPLILWILLALLPLRGWAMSDMQVSMATSALAASSAEVVMVQAAHEMQASAAAPCHGEGASSQADNAPQSSSGTHSACSLCDLCHSVAMVHAQTALSTAPTAAVRRVSLVSVDTGRALIDRLDRPPRSA
jgi:Co/Zn/Cd efflux system component